MSVTFVARFFCSTRYYFVLLGFAFCSIPFLFVRFIVVNEIIALLVGIKGHNNLSLCMIKRYDTVNLKGHSFSISKCYVNYATNALFCF